MEARGPSLGVVPTRGLCRGDGACTGRKGRMVVCVSACVWPCVCGESQGRERKREKKSGG